MRHCPSNSIIIAITEYPGKGNKFLVETLLMYVHINLFYAVLYLVQLTRMQSRSIHVCVCTFDVITQPTNLLLLGTGATASSIALGARQARGITLNIILRNVGEGMSSLLVGCAYLLRGGPSRSLTLLNVGSNHL